MLELSPEACSKNWDLVEDCPRGAWLGARPLSRARGRCQGVWHTRNEAGLTEYRTTHKQSFNLCNYKRKISLALNYSRFVCNVLTSLTSFVEML